MLIYYGLEVNQERKRVWINVYLSNDKESMKGDSSLAIPFSLILSYSHSEFNFHFVICYDNNCSWCKVFKDIMVVSTLIFGTNQMCKVLFMICYNLRPVLQKYVPLLLITNPLHSLGDLFSQLTELY